MPSSSFPMPAEGSMVAAGISSPVSTSDARTSALVQASASRRQ